jgi:hypothetical protein
LSSEYAASRPQKPSRTSGQAASAGRLRRVKRLSNFLDCRKGPQTLSQPRSREFRRLVARYSRSGKAFFSLAPRGSSPPPSPPPPSGPSHLSPPTRGRRPPDRHGLDAGPAQRPPDGSPHRLDRFGPSVILDRCHQGQPRRPRRGCWCATTRASRLEPRTQANRRAAAPRRWAVSTGSRTACHRTARHRSGRRLRAKCWGAVTEDLLQKGSLYETLILDMAVLRAKDFQP